MPNPSGYPPDTAGLRGSLQRVSPGPDTVDSTELQQLVDDSRWYHTIELAPGVTTPGFFDHRAMVGRYGLPDSLIGLRALDVGTFDGFWAFELERRGAEVVALDIEKLEDLDWPPRLRESGLRGEAANADMQSAGRSFGIAHRALSSSVRREVVSVYDATPERLGGTFDLVFCGSVLAHLRDPALALERMAGLCHGQLVFADVYSRKLGWLPFPVAEFTGESPWMTWWVPSSRTWCSMVRCAGFENVHKVDNFTLAMRGARRGVPHVVIYARGPAPPQR